MATNTASTCLRAAVRSQQALRSQTLRSAQRTFSISSRLQARQPPSSKQPSPPKPDPYTVPPVHNPDIPSTFTNLASQIRASAPLSTTEPYIAYGGTEDLFAECARQADYTIPQALLEPPQPAPQNAAGDHLGVGTGWWLEPKSAGGLGLDVTFNAWAQVCMLHMYILTVRLRAFPKDVVGPWHQNLLDHFFYAAEDKMAMWHGMSSRHVRNKNLKLIHEQWRGAQLSYDEGLVKGDAVLGTAVWRTLMKGNENVDIGDLVRIVAYIRREIQSMGKVEDWVVCEGRVKFGNPKEIEIDGKAKMLGQSFTGEDLAALTEANATEKR